MRSQILAYTGNSRCQSLESMLKNDPSIHRITISASVGAGGVNRHADVLRIQQALNKVPAIRGGPPAPIKEDGLFGGQTDKTIRRYQWKQLGMSDGRIDPHGLTIRHLSVDEDFHPMEGEDLVRFAVALIPRVTGKLIAAQAALMLAYNEQQGKTLLGHSNLDLLERVFQLSKFPSPQFELLQIKHLVERMLAAASRRTNSPDVAFTGVFAPNQVLVEDFTALAYTTMGGWDMSGKTVTWDPPLGSTVRADKIFLTRGLGDETISNQVYALIHELAHFCGPDRLNPNCVDDHAYGDLDWPEMSRLLPWQRTHNADHLAQYVWRVSEHQGPTLYS